MKLILAMFSSLTLLTALPTAAPHFSTRAECAGCAIGVINATSGVKPACVAQVMVSVSPQNGTCHIVTDGCVENASCMFTVRYQITESSGCTGCIERKFQAGGVSFGWLDTPGGFTYSHNVSPGCSGNEMLYSLKLRCKASCSGACAGNESIAHFGDATCNICKFQ